MSLEELIEKIYEYNSRSIHNSAKFILMPLKEKFKIFNLLKSDNSYFSISGKLTFMGCEIIGTDKDEIIIAQ